MSTLFFLILSLYLLIFEIILTYRWYIRINKLQQRFIFLILTAALLLFFHITLFISFYFSKQELKLPDATGIWKYVYLIYFSYLYPFTFYFPFYLAGLIFLILILRFYDFFIFLLRKYFLKKPENPQENNPYFRHDEQRGLLSRREIIYRSWDSIPLFLSSMSLIKTLVSSDELTVNRLILKIRNLPGAANGLTILHISDLHAGTYIGRAHLNEILYNAKKLKYDILMITGDMIDSNLAYLTDLKDFLKQMRSMAKSAFSVTGNHEWYSDAKRIIKVFEEAGFRHLRNEVVHLPRFGISITGLDHSKEYFKNRTLRLSDSVRNYQRIEPHARKFNIVLNHYPDTFSELKSNGLLSKVSLFLCGHTHGGQISFANRDHLMIGDESPAGRFIPYIGGLYMEEESYLYVNRGAGHWYPLRINCPREIAHFTLKPADNKHKGY